jgi:G:T-mismatch repair DNA endonuclease (very short patch repair protein)
VSLKREGWRVVTVWECKLKNNPHNVLRRIRSAMKNTNG